MKSPALRARFGVPRSATTVTSAAFSPSLAAAGRPFISTNTTAARDRAVRRIRPGISAVEVYDARRGHPALYFLDDEPALPAASQTLVSVKKHPKYEIR